MRYEIETAALRGRLDAGGRLRVTTESVRRICGSSVQLRHGAATFAGSYSERVGPDLSRFHGFILLRLVPECPEPGQERTLNRPQTNRKNAPTPAHGVGLRAPGGNARPSTGLLIRIPKVRQTILSALL